MPVSGDGWNEKNGGLLRFVHLFRFEPIASGGTLAGEEHIESIFYLGRIQIPIFRKEFSRMDFLL